MRLPQPHQEIEARYHSGDHASWPGRRSARSAGLGDYDAALRALEATFDQRSGFMALLTGDPLCHRFRHDPGDGELTKRVEVVEG